MKKQNSQIVFFVIILLCIGFGIGLIGNEKNIVQADRKDSTQALSDTEFEDLVDVYHQNDISVDGWKLYSRGSIDTISNLDGFQQRANELKIKMDQFSWEESIEEDSWKLVGTAIDGSTNIKKTIQFISTHTKTNPTTYLLFEMEGTNTTVQSPKKIQQLFDQQIDNIYQEEYESFACITGMTGDKINAGLLNLTNQLLQDFQATEMESLKEDTFISISAYNEKWDRVIPTNHGLINLQIGLRKERMGEKITVVIGTPIITIEY